MEARVLRGGAVVAAWLGAWLRSGAERLPAAEPPGRADFLASRGGKPPEQSHLVPLTLVNRRDRAVWLVLPYWGDKPLPKNGVFPNTDRMAQPFGGRQFAGEGGSAVEVRMYGGNGFKALHLPPQGQLDLDGYIF